MITLIWHHIFYKKKLIATAVLLVCYIVILTAVVMTSDTPLDRKLFPIETYLYYQVVSKQIIVFVCAAMLATIVFDFESSYDLPLYAYFSKSKVIHVKLVTHVFVVFVMALLVATCRLGFAVLYYDFLDIDFLLDNLWFISDMMILCLWMILLTPAKFKQSSFLVVAIYLLFMIISEDLTNPWLFYGLPFQHHVYSSYHLTYIYVMIYGFMLYLLVYLKETYKAC